jgi:hypothetical protein
MMVKKMKPANQGLISVIREDETYKTFKQILTDSKRGLDMEDLTKEIMGLHAGRSSRNLTGDGRYSPKTLLDANTTDMSARARMTEIRVKTDKKVGSLRKGIVAMRKHILTKYSEELKAYGGVTLQKAVADRVMKLAIEYIEEAEMLISSIDTLIRDIDAAGHAMHRCGELIKLLSEGRGRTL